MHESDIDAWRRADAAFDRLLRLPPAERGRAAEQIELDADARACLRRLLASDREDAVALADDAPSAPADDLIGRRISRWVLEARIGQGGMATVYRAHAIDDSGRRVAIKLLTLGGLAGPGSDRFVRERGILGRLDHPAITPLIDAGVAPDGTPWLAMGLVDGERIDHWCQTRRLDARHRVSLMIEVCEAVSFAHRQLVVHRDLKPSNVLVDVEGRVRLLDFGIARLLHDSVEDVTATRWRALSPRFAAPEQFTGAPPSTAMDVFGLGALLYAMLVGRPPRETEHPGAAIEAPSRAVFHAAADGHAEGAISARELIGDLDAIVLKALAYDPSARYAGALDLADDLRLWLSGEPVRALPRGPVRRALGLVRRHAIAIGLASTVVASIVAGGITAVWQARRAQAAQQEAEAAVSRASALRAFLVGLFDAEAPGAPGAELPTTGELLARGESDAMADVGMEPQVRADMLDALTEVRLARGESASASELIDATLAIADSLPDGGSVVRARALLRRSVVDRLHGRLDEAIAALEAARALLESRAGSELALTVQRERASALWQAERHEEAVATVERLLGGIEGRSDLPREFVATVHSIAGAVFGDVGRLDDSLAHYEWVVADRRERFGPRHFRVAVALANAANAARRSGRLDIALQRNTEALAIYDAVLDGRPSDYRGSAHSGRGWIELARGDFDAALASFERGAQEFAVARGRGSATEGWVLPWTRGITLATAGRWTEAIEPLDQAVLRLQELRPPLRQSLLVAHAWVARTRCALGDHEVADTALAAARSQAKSIDFPLPEELSLLDEADAACRLAAGDAPAALNRIGSAIERDDAGNAGYVDQRARRRLLAADILRVMGRESEAAARVGEADALLDGAGITGHPYRRESGTIAGH